MAKVSKEKIHEVDLSQIDEPHGSIRMEINPEEISELAQSISEIGLLQPIILRERGERLEVVAGHRRFLAHKELNKNSIPAIVKDIDDQAVALLRATENLQRVDLTPLEEAAIYCDLIDVHNITIEKLAQRLGKPQNHVYRRLEIIKMPPSLQEAIQKKQVGVSVAKELWRISDPERMKFYLDCAIENGVTREVVRDWVKDWERTTRVGSVASDRGGGVAPPYLDRPHYVDCDLCYGPMKIGDETVFRTCPACTDQLKNALKG